MQQLEQMARDESVMIQNYRRGRIVAHPTHSRLIVHVAIRSSYAGLCGLLDRLENMQRVAVVESMEIRGDADAPIYPVQLTLALYFGLKQPDTMNEATTDGAT